MLLRSNHFELSFCLKKKTLAEILREELRSKRWTLAVELSQSYLSLRSIRRVRYGSSKALYPSAADRAERLAPAACGQQTRPPEAGAVARMNTKPVQLNTCSKNTWSADLHRIGLQEFLVLKYSAVKDFILAKPIILSTCLRSRPA